MTETKIVLPAWARTDSGRRGRRKNENQDQKKSGHGEEQREEGGGDSRRYEFTSLHELRSDCHLPLFPTPIIVPSSFSSQEPTIVVASKTPPPRHRQQLHALTSLMKGSVHAYPEETTST